MASGVAEVAGRRARRRGRRGKARAAGHSAHLHSQHRRAHASHALFNAPLANAARNRRPAHPQLFSAESSTLPGRRPASTSPTFSTTTSTPTHGKTIARRFTASAWSFPCKTASTGSTPAPVARPSLSTPTCHPNCAPRLRRNGLGAAHAGRCSLRCGKGLCGGAEFGGSDRRALCPRPRPNLLLRSIPAGRRGLVSPWGRPVKVRGGGRGVGGGGAITSVRVRRIVARAAPLPICANALTQYISAGPPAQMYMQQRPPGMAAGQFVAHQGPRPGFLPHPGGPGAYGAPHGLPMRPMMPGMRPGMPSGGYGPPHGGMQQRPPMMAPPGYGPPQPGPPGMQQYPGMYGGPPAQYGSGGYPGGGPATNMCGDGLGAREGCAARVRRCPCMRTTRDDAATLTTPTLSPRPGGPGGPPALHALPPDRRAHAAADFAAGSLSMGMDLGGDRDRDRRRRGELLWGRGWRERRGWWRDAAD